ncbi:hypothetical protein HFN_0947 [Helicobacter fennelliae MRY12-0050]|uniref:Uncharacterized protein n=1 Tax=Helicobacter fennelliae MRY12-0050 TaxID=1325130 RepID=T1DWU0_9HELI|nr:hypothetical protein HFN_0947 [Helicobacter fennelliae MRY12-0050]
MCRNFRQAKTQKVQHKSSSQAKNSNFLKHDFSSKTLKLHSKK